MIGRAEKEKFKTTELPDLDMSKVLLPLEVIMYITEFKDLIKEWRVLAEKSRKWYYME